MTRGGGNKKIPKFWWHNLWKPPTQSRWERKIWWAPLSLALFGIPSFSLIAAAAGVPECNFMVNSDIALRGLMWRSAECGNFRVEDLQEGPFGFGPAVTACAKSHSSKFGRRLGPIQSLPRNCPPKISRDCFSKGHLYELPETDHFFSTFTWWVREIVQNLLGDIFRDIIESGPWSRKAKCQSVVNNSK